MHNNIIVNNTAAQQQQQVQPADDVIITNPQQQQYNANVLVIGPNNVFEVGCHVEAGAIGERNVFEYKSHVAAGVQVSSGCVVGAGCRLSDARQLPDNTVIFGPNNQQRIAIEKPTVQSQQLESLRKILPNYHHLIKPTYDPKKARGRVV